MANRPLPELTRPAPAASPPGSALVIGGGLAGIAAAARLAESGWQVTLLEARATLGGRAFSYRDPQTGRELDNGQHVIVGACRNLINFLERIGARHLWRIQPRLNVAVYDRAGRRGRLYGAPAPAPAHLLPAFLTYPHLGPLDKLKAVRGLMAAIRANRRQPALEAMTFYDWLRRRGQSERTIDNLWNVLIEGTLNDNVRAVSAAMGLMIVQDGLLQGRRAANVGYPLAALGDAIGKPAQRYLRRLGVRIMPGCPANGINFHRRREPGRAPPVQSVSAGRAGTFQADAYISAVPFWVLPNLLPACQAAAAPFASLSRLQSAPIVNIHLRYDRAVMAGDFCYFLDSPLQWVFNRSRIAGCPGAGQSLTVSISAAWDFVNRPRRELAAMVINEMRQAFPAAGRAAVADSAVVKQRNATFRCTPGANRLRPGPRTPSPNLFLAGEWTDTGWPSTMESAVISGYNAANAVMSYNGVSGAQSENRSARPMG